MYLQQKERKWILVVDDDNDLRESMIELIKHSFGDEVCVVEARDGVEATCKINCQAFDCIITDIDMPKKEGGAFLTSVRNNLFNEQTPVVVVSGLTDKETFVQSFPFACFVAKPFQSAQLTEIIKNKMKIGKNGNAVSADVFNVLISTTLAFLESLTNSKNINTGIPRIKAAGSSVDADMVSSVQVKLGKAICTFSILITDIATQKIVQKMGNKSDKNAQEIQQSMSQIILKHVISKTQGLKEKSFDLQSINYSKESLTDKKGIVVPLGVDDIELQIFATTK